MPSQRQLRVGEEIRHALAGIFREESFYELGMEDLSLTISEVRISPDLKNATVYVAVLGKDMPPELLSDLNAYSPRLRYLVTQRVRLKHSPTLTFRLDKSFEQAEHIETILSTLDDTHS